VNVTGLIPREIQPPASHLISLITQVPTESLVDFRHSMSSNHPGLSKDSLISGSCQSEHFRTNMFFPFFSF